MRFLDLQIAKRKAANRLVNPIAAFAVCRGGRGDKIEFFCRHQSGRDLKTEKATSQRRRPIGCYLSKVA